MDRDEWMTSEEIAELLKVSQETVRRWIRGGDLPVLDLGSARGGYRIRRVDLDAFLRARYGTLRAAVRAAPPASK